jgi:hypothetical protein
MTFSSEHNAVEKVIAEQISIQAQKRNNFGRKSFAKSLFLRNWSFLSGRDK